MGVPSAALILKFSCICMTSTKSSIFRKTVLPSLDTVAEVIFTSSVPCSPLSLNRSEP